jgi:ADP-ribosylglycohydrolase
MGTAIGDSLGLPYEGLSSSRAKKLFAGSLRQRLMGSKGTVSDDTVQSGFVLHALMNCNGSEDAFQRLLAKDLRRWFLSIPPGIGMATIKSCLRLVIGMPPARSGVNSAGNGAAMRAAVIGAALSHSEEDRIRFVRASTRVTHTHPDAEHGAQLVALAAASQARGELSRFHEFAPEVVSSWKWSVGWSDKGPSGYVVQTVNAAILVCLEPDILFTSAIERAIELGGDTDTVAAIVGGILGAGLQIRRNNDGVLLVRSAMDDGDSIKSFMHARWANYFGWPQPEEIESLKLHTSYFRLLGQHLVALPAILAFGFRRLLPPY